MATGQTGLKRKRGRLMDETPTPPPAVLTSTPPANGHDTDEARVRLAVETYATERFKQQREMEAAFVERDTAIQQRDAANARAAGLEMQVAQAKEWATFLESQIAIHAEETRRTITAFEQARGQLSAIKAVILKQEAIVPPAVSDPGPAPAFLKTT